MVFTLKDIHVEKIGEEMEWSSLHITIMKNRFRKLLSCEKVGGKYMDLMFMICILRKKVTKHTYKSHICQCRKKLLNGVIYGG